MLGRGQARLQRRRLQGGQESLGHCSLDSQAAHAHVVNAPSVHQFPRGAEIARGGLGGTVVINGKLATAYPAGGQALQEGAAFSQRPRAGLVRPGAGVGPGTGLVGLVGLPVDVALVVARYQHLPLGPGQHAPAGTDLAGPVDITFMAGLAEHVGASVGGVGQDVVDRGVSRPYPGELLVGLDIGDLLQWELEALFA